MLLASCGQLLETTTADESELPGQKMTKKTSIQIYIPNHLPILTEERSAAPSECDLAVLVTIKAYL